MGMKPVGIKCVAMAAGGRQGPAGAWLKSYDPEAFRGRGSAEWTDDPTEALVFTEPVEAFRYWKQTSRTRPYREDGRPNRPLTAFTIEVVAVP